MKKLLKLNPSKLKTLVKTKEVVGGSANSDGSAGASEGGLPRTGDWS